MTLLYMRYSNPVAAKLVADKRVWDCNNFNRILIVLPFSPSLRIMHNV